MPTSLNLTLPEGPPPRPRVHLLHILTFAGVAAVLAVVLLQKGGGPPAATESPERLTELERLKKLAENLERMTLHVEAERVWAEYMALADLSPDKKGETLYRRGKCLKEGGKYSEAARMLLDAETLPLDSETKQRCRQLLLECLSSVGKQDARDWASRAFATGVADEKGTALARVGSDLITKEWLRGRLIADAEQLLRGAPLTPAERSKQAADVADKEMKDPESLKKVLSQVLSTRVLYREALERGFGEDAAMAEAVSRFREEFAARRVVEAEMEKALENLGPTEISNHYEAHKGDYVEKAGAEFSFARFSSLEEAEGALKKLGDPGTAGSVKLEKAKGWAVAGQPVPGIGPAAEICAHILALEEGKTSARPVEHQGAWYIFRADARRPERQLGLQEAENQVRADLAAVKRKEAIENLQAQLSQKFQVEILEPAAAAPQPKEKEEEKGKQVEAQGTVKT